MSNKSTPFLNQPGSITAPLTPDEMRADTQKHNSKPKNPEVKTLVPAPDNAPKFTEDMPSYFNKKFGCKPSAIYPYHCQDGRLACYMARWDGVKQKDGSFKKEFIPFTYCQEANGERKWCPKGLPESRPLYHADQFLKRPDAPILICEGEKTAHAAARLFPNYIATTALHGAQSPHKADWSLVKGRKVVITIDHDGAGEKYGKNVCKLCQKAGAESINFLDMNLFARFAIQNGEIIEQQRELPEKYDLFDAEKEGWIVETIQQLQLKAQELGKPFLLEEQTLSFGDSEAPEPDVTYVGDYKLTTQGVYYQKQYHNNYSSESAIEWIRFCSYLLVKGYMRDSEGKNWCCVFRLVDRDGLQKDVMIPMEFLSGNGEELRKRLLSNGLALELDARKHLERYIASANPEARMRSVDTLGWIGECYVRPEKVYGETHNDEEIIYQGKAFSDSVTCRGTLSEWNEKVGKYIPGNPILCLVTGATLAAPFLKLLNEENFAIHLSGPSSIGKTTALRVARSICGSPIRSWRTTDNAAESLAKQANDWLLIFDELSEVDAKAADNMTYMLGNGSGKARANKSGEAKPAVTFRTLILSTGEIGLESKLNGIGKSQKAGQTVRFIEISADAGVGYGIFNAIHEFSSSNELAQYLKNVTEEACGAIMDEWLTMLVDLQIQSDSVKIVQHLRDQWVEAFSPPESDWQVKRCARKFGLIAAVGELAIINGLLTWPNYKDSLTSSAPLGDFSYSINQVFQSFLKNRGGCEDSHEIQQAIHDLVSFIEEHGSSRFENPWGTSTTDNSIPVDQKVFQRAGFKRLKDGSWHYYFFRDIFKREVLKDKSPNFITQLIKKGAIIPSSEGKSTSNVTIPGHKQFRLICIAPDILTKGQSDE